MSPTVGFTPSPTSSDQSLGAGDSDDQYHSEGSDYDDYDDWDTSDSESVGFFTGTHDDADYGMEAQRFFAPPVHVHAFGTDILDPVDSRTTRQRPSYLDDLPRQFGESELAFKIRKSQWKDVRGLLGPRAMAAGGAGVRLAAEPPVEVKGKGTGKAPKSSGGSKRTGDETNPHANVRVDFFDLTNAILLRAPADVLLALLAVAPRGATARSARSTSAGARSKMALVRSKKSTRTFA